MKRIRTLLCVPAHKPELYEKAARTAADCLMFDLEDSVPAHHKDGARWALLRYLETARHALGKLVAVRINPDSHLTDDCLAFDGTGLADLIVVPKVCGPHDLTNFNDLTLPVIETPQAIVNLRAILGLPTVVGGIFGVADFAAGMGVSDRVFAGYVDFGPLVNQRFAYAKQKLAVYAAAFHKQALDTCFNVRSPWEVERTWIGARGMGFTGAAAIHPMQVEVGNRIFASEFEREWAEEIHAEHAARNGEVGVDKGGLVVGKPVDRQAHAIIGRSS